MFPLGLVQGKHGCRGKILVNEHVVRKELPAHNRREIEVLIEIPEYQPVRNIETTIFRWPVIRHRAQHASGIEPVRPSSLSESGSGKDILEKKPRHKLLLCPETERKGIGPVTLPAGKLIPVEPVGMPVCDKASHGKSLCRPVI